LNDGSYNGIGERASDQCFKSPQPSENGVLKLFYTLF